jgi:hypothetical protein
MFRSREERERQHQLEREKQEKKRELQQQIQSLEARIKERRQEWQKRYDAYKVSVSDKWEYLEVTSQQLSHSGLSLDALGRLGWELAGVASYNVGMGTLTWYQYYVLKRRVPEPPAELVDEGSDIPGLEMELVGLQLQLEG